VIPRQPDVDDRGIELVKRDQPALHDLEGVDGGCGIVEEGHDGGERPAAGQTHGAREEQTPFDPRDAGDARQIRKVTRIVGDEAHLQVGEALLPEDAVAGPEQAEQAGVDAGVDRHAAGHGQDDGERAPAHVPEIAPHLDAQPSHARRAPG
jgi:hypothetical protein